MNPYQSLVDVALGRQPADLIIVNGTLINTQTAELLPGWGVAVYQGRIAAIGDVSHCQGPETEVVDATGLYLSPGFVDPHYHIESSHLTPARHAEVTVPWGLTTLVEDPHEASAVVGAKALDFFLEAAAHLPQRILTTVSSATPPSPFETIGGYIGGAETAKALERKGVLGLGELMDPPRLFQREPRVWGQIEAARAQGRRLEGHGGMLPPAADAFAAIGIGSSHSPRHVDEALAMLRRGLFLQLQMERSEEILKAILAAGVDLGNVGLAVDDRPAHQLQAVGPMNEEIRRAIKAGVAPARAYQMATFNNARYWRLEEELGVLAPGRVADILLISDLADAQVERVYFGGKLVAAGGRLLAPVSAPVPTWARGTVHLPHPLTPNHFAIAGAGETAQVVVLDVNVRKELPELIATVPVVNGELQAVPGSITKAAVIDRHSGKGGMGKGFYRFGLKRGAIAFTVLHDSHNLCVVGVNDADMAVAANRVAELDGGIVVVADGEILAELALPVLGLMTDAPLAEVVAAHEKLETAGKALGLDTSILGDHPVDRLTFVFLTCHPRKYQLTDQGLFNLLTGEPLPLIQSP